MFTIGDFAGHGRVRVAELTGVAASYEPRDIGLVIRPLYEALGRRLHAAGVAATGPRPA